MNIEQLNQQIIINEWQLGQQLNTAVHSGTRDKFNLLLSFLSDDACDFAEFTHQQTNEDVKQEADLRLDFNLSPTQPLMNEGPSVELLAELNRDLHNTKMTEIRFKQLLTNEAILSKKITGIFPEDILDNLSLQKRQRVNNTSKTDISTDNGSDVALKGIDINLLDEYKKLDLVNRPLQVRSA